MTAADRRAHRRLLGAPLPDPFDVTAAEILRAGVVPTCAVIGCRTPDWDGRHPGQTPLCEAHRIAAYPLAEAELRLFDGDLAATERVPAA